MKYSIPNSMAVKRKRHYLNIFFMVLFALALPFLLGLLESGVNQERLSATFSNYYRFFVASGILFFVLFSLESYMHVRHADKMDSRKQLLVIMLVITLTYFFAIIFGAFISVYTMPLVMSGLLIGMLIERQLALFGNVLINLAFFFLYLTISPGSDISGLLSAVITSSISGCIFVIVMRHTYTRMSFFIKSLIIGLFVAIPVAILCTLINVDFTAFDILVNSLWAFVSIVLSVAFFMVLLPMFESIFRLYTNFRLEELCSAEYPLLRKLATEAPGTYNHSLAVGNIAEACAIKIGENPALAKACAYYHDLGKIKNPICFTENQKGYNPHDDFIPEVSIKMITDHTDHGYDLLKQNKFPSIIADTAREHHGTTAVKYFYHKVRNITDEELEQEEFCYQGPKPQTKVAAIIMIADTVEAATRAQGIDQDIENFRSFIHGLIQDKVRHNQFDECPLTLKDIKDIEDTLVETIPSLYHQRIKYSK
ncbi:MAG: HD domain-containing protein [Clostridiales bacterium]|nr:HD domain-containing protein [Clostridiales bacterium]